MNNAGAGIAPTHYSVCIVHYSLQRQLHSPQPRRAEASPHFSLFTSYFSTRRVVRAAASGGEGLQLAVARAPSAGCCPKKLQYQQRSPQPPLILPFGSQSRQPVAASGRRAARCSRAPSPATACRDKAPRRSTFRIFGFAQDTPARQNASKLAFALANSYLCPLAAPEWGRGLTQ